MLYDEATSALDGNTEREVARALESLGSHTGLLVAHRLTTVMDADKILVLGNGILNLGLHMTDEQGV